jgi:hypothetical protein
VDIPITGKLVETRAEFIQWDVDRAGCIFNGELLWMANIE